MEKAFKLITSNSFQKKKKGRFNVWKVLLYILLIISYNILNEVIA